MLFNINNIFTSIQIEMDAISACCILISNANNTQGNLPIRLRQTPTKWSVKAYSCHFKATTLTTTEEKNFEQLTQLNRINIM